MHSTAVGYSGGYTPNPTYEEVCSGRTGHAEVVLVVFDDARTSYDKLLSIFLENHDPTQGMCQGNDAGTQYRSATYTTTPAQQLVAERSRDEYQLALDAARLSRAAVRQDGPPAGPDRTADPPKTPGHTKPHRPGGSFSSRRIVPVESW
jgi:peptide-methionine (S)-S-oxide reductase